MSTISFFVGIDLGNDNHAICVINAQRQRVKSIAKISNDQQVLGFILGAIGDVDLATVYVGLEDRNNVVVDALLAKGFTVFTINPKQLDRFRDRESASGAKDDRRDASVLANALATNETAFHQVVAFSELQVRCASMTSRNIELRGGHRMFSNMLRAVVLRFFPALLSLCEGADEKWFWALLLFLRDANHAKTIRRTTLEKFLKSHRLRAVTVDDLLKVINAEHLPANEHTTTVRRDHAASLIRVLRLLEKEQHQLAKEMEQRVKDEAAIVVDGKPSQVAILMSMKGIGAQSCMMLVGSCGQLMTAGKLDVIRCLSGSAPVTQQSGKYQRVRMRRAADPDLRNTMMYIARTASRTGRFKRKYDEMRAKGHNSARALRSIADSLLTILMSMLKTNTLYDETRHAA